MTKFLSTVALVAAAVAAQPAVAAPFNGPHVGLLVGFNAHDTQFQDYWCNVACDAPTAKGIDLAAGLTAGYDVRVDENFVVGIEGDVGFGANSRDENFYTDTYNSGYYNQTYTYNVDVKRMTTLRLRAGLALGNTMLYTTGGLANAKVRYSAEGAYTGGYGAANNYGAAGSQAMTGYSIGGGIEHAFGPVSVKAEMLHNDLGKSKKACFADLAGTDAGVCYSGDEDNLVVTPVLNSVRIGINYNF